MGPFQGQQIFFRHLDNHPELDLGILDHNMQKRQKLIHFEQAKGLKPHFGPYLALNGLSFGLVFSKIRLRQFPSFIAGYHHAKNQENLMTGSMRILRYRLRGLTDKAGYRGPANGKGGSQKNHNS